MQVVPSFPSLSALNGIPVVESALLRCDQAMYDGVNNRIICGNVDFFYIRVIAHQQLLIGLKFIRDTAARVRAEIGLPDDTSQ